MKKMIKNKKNNLLFTIGIISITRPGLFTAKIPHFSTLMNLFYMACFVFLVFVILDRVRVSDIKRLSNVILPILLYGWILTVTIITKGEVSTVLNRLLGYTYCLLLSIVCCKYDTDSFIRIARNILFALIIINTISIIAFPSGMYSVSTMTHELDERYWFIGFKNAIGKYQIILITLCCFTQIKTKKNIDKMVTLISITASVISSIIIESGSGLIGAIFPLVITLYVYAFKEKKIYNIARMRNYFAVVAITFFLVVFTSKLLENALVQLFITQLLHKPLTLSGRIDIWNSVLRIIQKNFWIGIGYQGGDYNARLIGGSNNTVDAHDYYLEFILEGGIVAGVILLLMFLHLTKKIDNARKYPEVGVLAGGLFTIMIIFITENSNNNYIWLFYGICLSIDTYIEKKKHFTILS